MLDNNNHILRERAQWAVLCHSVNVDGRNEGDGMGPCSLVVTSLLYSRRFTLGAIRYAMLAICCHFSPVQERRVSAYAFSGNVSPLIHHPVHLGMGDSR